MDQPFKIVTVFHRPSANPGLHSPDRLATYGELVEQMSNVLGAIKDNEGNTFKDMMEWISYPGEGRYGFENKEVPAGEPFMAMMSGDNEGERIRGFVLDRLSGDSAALMFTIKTFGDQDFLNGVTRILNAAFAEGRYGPNLSPENGGSLDYTNDTTITVFPDGSFIPVKNLELSPGPSM